MKGASTILLQYLLLNMFIDLKNYLGEIGAKRLGEHEEVVKISIDVN